jgi:hypothetical protein
MVRKAEREGFVFDVHTDTAGDLSWFTTLYDDTQNFLSAGTETRFTASYFRALVAGLGERVWLGVVSKDGDAVAAVLVLDGETTSHCHLMGYRRLPKTAGMTNLAYHGIALEAARRGKLTLHMGGGRTADQQDSLLKFKESLSPKRSTFEIGMRCHDQRMYDMFGQQWESVYGPRPIGYFLYYRRPGPRNESINSSSS